MFQGQKTTSCFEYGAAGVARRSRLKADMSSAVPDITNDITWIIVQPSAGVRKYRALVIQRSTNTCPLGSDTVPKLIFFE